ncbi:MAG: hypothetical protein ACHQIO_22465, partial [Nevskiales bacterium]
MIDLLFVLGSLALFFALGQPLCEALPGTVVKGRMLAAPVIGFGLFGVAMTLLYRFGVPLAAADAIAIVAAAGIVAWHRRSLVFSEAALRTIAAIGVVVLLCLVPKWIGGPQFWAFQGNDQDQVNYLAYSAAMRARSYGDLMALTPATALDNDYLLGARSMLVARPTVCLAFAALATLSGRLTADVGYPFQVVMQVNMLFAATFLLLNCFRAPLRRCLLLGLALTVGFFLQYVFDIDAWSELASLPMVLVGLTAAITSMAGSRSWRDAGTQGATVAVTATSVLYFYPEAVLEFALPGLAALVVAASVDRRRGVAATVAALAAAPVLCLPFWRATIGHLYR